MCRMQGSKYKTAWQIEQSGFTLEKLVVLNGNESFSYSGKPLNTIFLFTLG